VPRAQAGAMQAAEDRVTQLAARLPAASVVRELLQGSELLTHAKAREGTSLSFGKLTDGDSTCDCLTELAHPRGT
jgi:hypothetical protein